MNKIRTIQNNTIAEYGLCFGIGLLVGLDYLPYNFVGVVYIMVSIACIYFAAQGDKEKVFCILPYLIFSERYIKNKIPAVPFLFMQYLFVGVFIIMLLRQKKTTVRLHSKAFIFLIFFCCIEIIDTFRSHDAVYARSLYINTMAITAVVAWGSFNFLSPAMMNRILNHVKLASIFLCGIILTRRFFGAEISYGLYSMSESLNGLSAVQMSGYLGFSSSVFFFSIMDEREGKQFWLNLIFLTVIATIMILSFSRGGIYFLGIIMVVYFLFNRNKVKSYFLFLLFIPIGFGVYSYVTKVTNGLVEQRFEEEGSSGRDDLVRAAYELFLDNPLAGVGTGNYGSAIENNDLYGGSSGVHNEFARAAAEHGILGILTYWGFFAILFFEILARGKIQREYALYFLLLFCMITVHNGLKISVQPYLLVLAVATPTLKVSKKKKANVPASKKLAIGS